MTAIARELQRFRLFQYRHGRIRILDRHGLQAVVCQCCRSTTRRSPACSEADFSKVTRLKYTSTPRRDRINLMLENGRTSSRLPAFGLFFLGTCPNDRERHTISSLELAVRVSPVPSKIRAFPASVQQANPQRTGAVGTAPPRGLIECQSSVVAVGQDGPIVYVSKRTPKPQFYS